MKRLRIDFAAPSVARTVFQTHPLAWLAAALAVLLCAWAAQAALQLSAARHAADSQQGAAERRAARQAAPVAVSSSKIDAQQAQAVNSLVLQLNLPWRDLHDAISVATPPTIALLSIEPDARKHVLKLTAEARTSDAMIDYIDALKGEAFFAGAVLTRHDINDQDPNKPIRFQVDAQWVSR